MADVIADIMLLLTRWSSRNLKFDIFLLLLKITLGKATRVGKSAHFFKAVQLTKKYNLKKKSPKSEKILRKSQPTQPTTVRFPLVQNEKLSS